ncbi:hypothetical protein BGW80DRAFT_1396490 [Lactifluus volemus]|nr:hypothetical protein BGW80DRAFT_1396490 [Lactifluus volemus]
MITLSLITTGLFYRVIATKLTGKRQHQLQQGYVGTRRHCPMDCNVQLTDPTGVYQEAISFQLDPEHRDEQWGAECL